jgi:hypothetical protein
VSTSITNHHSWDSKPWKYHFFKHLLRVSGISSSAWQSFDTFGNIVDCHLDVFTVLRFQEWSHVINIPAIKQLDLEVVSEHHGISWINVAMLLTRSASSDKVLRVFIHGWSKESTLPNFCIYLECPIVSSIGWWVTTFNDFDSFFSWYTSSEHTLKRHESSHMWRRLS